MPKYDESDSIPFHDHAMMRYVICLLIFCFSLPLCAEEPKGVKPLRVVYFSPSDKTPEPDRQERLGRTLKQIQEFYRQGMKANGYGPKTFALEWDSPGKLKLIEVKGKKKTTDYPKNSGWIIYDEVKEALKGMFPDIRKEHVLVLGQFLHWEGDVATECGPYAGSGWHGGGVCWAVEDKLLDSDLLSSNKPGAYHHFVKHCSLGRFNTYYVGGLAHELGHCFDVPHDSQTDEQKEKQGISLMGSGNHHYGKKLRGEEPDVFMTPATAMHLSVCPAFDPGFKTGDMRSSWQIEKLDAVYKNDKIILDGKTGMNPGPVGIIAYNDNTKIKDDYDAKAWTAKPDEQGVFRFEISELQKVPYEMRLVALFPGGHKRTLKISYTNLDGTPNVEAFAAAVARKRINELLDARNDDEVAKILDRLIKDDPSNNDWKRKREHLKTVRKDVARTVPAACSATEKKMNLALAQASEEKVGWYNPSRNILRECGFMEVDGMFFESGIYAHPNSKYVFLLGKQWKELRFAFGLQDGKPGSVVFVVRGDGKELFRSRTVVVGELLLKRISVSGVDELELSTEDAGDGWSNDWGLWIEPELIR